MRNDFPQKIGPFLERGISFRANSRTGYQFKGKFFLERGANLESRAAHTHPKNIHVPPPPGGGPHAIFVYFCFFTLTLMCHLSGQEAFFVIDPRLVCYLEHCLYTYLRKFGYQIISQLLSTIVILISALPCHHLNLPPCL